MWRVVGSPHAVFFELFCSTLLFSHTEMRINQNKLKRTKKAASFRDRFERKQVMKMWIGFVPFRHGTVFNCLYLRLSHHINWDRNLGAWCHFHFSELLSCLQIIISTGGALASSITSRILTKAPAPAKIVLLSSQMHHCTYWAPSQTLLCRPLTKSGPVHINPVSENSMSSSPVVFYFHAPYQRSTKA